MTPVAVFGVGAAATEEAALDVALSDAAKAISVDVREEMTDTQLVWIGHQGAKSAERSQDRIARAASFSVERRLDGCRRSDTCRDEHAAVHMLVSCERRESALERELVAAARKIAAADVRVGPLLGVPGSDDKGYVTQLGQYALNVVRSALMSAKSGAYQVVAAPPWEPSELHEAARRSGATHLLRVEYLLLGRTRVRSDVYLQDAETDRRVPGSSVAFEVELDPAQLSLLTVQGPLLPQKEAQDLVNASGTYPLPLRLSKTDLREAEQVSIEVTAPRAGYLYVYDLYEDGRATLLLPNPVSRDNRVAAHASVRLPDAAWEQAGIKLQACPLKRQKLTREYVKAILSPVQIDLVGARVSGSGFTALAPSSSEGGLSEVLARIEELMQAGVPIGTAEMPYFVRASSRPAPECAGE